jgi:hypothetical protein
MSLPCRYTAVSPALVLLKVGINMEYTWSILGVYLEYLSFIQADKWRTLMDGKAGSVVEFKDHLKT